MLLCNVTFVYIKTLAKKIKENLYTTYLKPVVSYVCSTWATTAGNKKKIKYY